MTDPEITALAREYAEELSPDNKINREMIELDCLGFLDRVLNSYCLVEKKDVEAKYQEAKERYFNPDDEIEKNNVWWKNVHARIPLPRNRKGGGGMNPLNIRFRAKRLKDGKLIEGHYVRLHYSITETRSNGTIVKVGEEIRHHIYNDKFPGNEPHWQEIDPDTLEVFEAVEQKTLFDEL